jgi:hypothetical protein
LDLLYNDPRRRSVRARSLLFTCHSPTSNLDQAEQESYFRSPDSSFRRTQAQSYHATIRLVRRSLASSDNIEEGDEDDDIAHAGADATGCDDHVAAHHHLGGSCQRFRSGLPIRNQLVSILLRKLSPITIVNILPIGRVRNLLEPRGHNERYDNHHLYLEAQSRAREERPGMQIVSSRKRVLG